MTKDNYTNPLILVVEDVHEIRDGMEKLLKADGYRVSLARNEQDALDNARAKRPDLILVSLPESTAEGSIAATRLREGIEVDPHVPVVFFCGGGIDEGDEVAIGHNVHLTRPDNFNQLRSLLARLLDQNLSAADTDASANVQKRN